MTELLPVYDGDTLLLHCPEATGYLYSEPLSSASNLLTVFPSREDKPQFPNIDFATFQITHGRLTNEDQIQGQWHIAQNRNEPMQQVCSEPMTIVYGSTIQLQHKASGKYLSITPTSSAWLDNGKTETSLFRIIPPRQEKGWGEDLIINDSIKFESIYYKGYRIQCVNNPLEASYHLVLAVTGTIFSMKSHCHKCVTIDPHIIKGGNIIMLSSMKIDGYLSIKGSFVNRKLPEKFQQSNKQVGLRRWRQGFFKILPFSGDTYLQFEKISNVSTGDPFVFGEECRIKNLPTQLYLSVSKTPHGIEVVAQDLKESNGSEIFKIIPVTLSSDTEQLKVQAFSHIALQHVKTKRLLSVNVRPVLHKKLSLQQDPLSQWFTLALEERKDEIPTTSIYEIIKVDEDACSDVYQVTGISTFICNQLKKVSHLFELKALDTKIAMQLTNLFQDIITQMTGLEVLFSTSLNKKRVTNMLRTFQAIDALVALLMELANSKTTIYIKHQACSSICTALERYCEIGNLKSRRYLAKRELLNTLMMTVGQGFGTEKVLISLSKNDVEMGDLMQEFLISLIEKLNTEDPEVAELMTTLAFSGRKYNKQIQEKIYERTLETGMVHNYNANADVKLILEGFLKTVSAHLETSGIATNRLVYTYDYMTLNSGGIQVTIDEEHIATFQAMTNSIHRYLSTNEMHILYAGNDFKGRNSILAQILGVLAFLVDYGTVSDDSQIDQVLIKILDGRSDEGLPGEPFHSHDRYNVLNFTGNKIVFKIKALVLLSLNLFLKRQFHASVESLLYDFKFLRGKGEEIYFPKILVEDDIDLTEEPHFSIEEPNTPSYSAALRSHSFQREESIHEPENENEIEDYPPDLIRPSQTGQNVSTTEAVELVEIAVKSKNTETEEKYPVYVPPPPEMNKLLDEEENITELLSQLSHDRLHYNFRSRSYPMFNIETQECQRLCCILMDLINYDDVDVCLMSTELLYSIYNVERILLSDAQGVYFTASGDVHQQELIKVATMTDEDQLISKMLRKEIHDVPKLLQKLEEFSNWCVSKEDVTEPNASNQGVAFSCGLFSDILEYVLEYGKSDDFGQEEILNSSFILLQKITRKNSRAQNKLFDSLNDFLDVKTGIASMTCLLNEVFANNSDLCKRLSEADIKHIFYTAIGSSNPDHYELTVTLGTIIENMEPATPLQEYITQLILDHWEDNLGHILGQDNQTNRLNLLQYAGVEDPELHLLLNVTDLLASCTTGECQFAESASRHFFTLDELLLILIDDNIIIHRKLPFVRVLTWTFLNTERDSALACSQLASNKNFWSHLEAQIHLIDEQLTKDINSLSDQHKRVLNVKLKSLGKANWSINQWIAFTTDFDDSSSTTITGNLLYIIEGIIPLLTGYCFEMSLHLSGANELCTDLLTAKEIGIVNNLGEKLLALYRLEVICASEQLNKLRQCITNITSLCDSLHETPIFSQIVLHSLNRPRALSHAYISSNPESTLNQSFQAYILKYSQSYDQLSFDGFDDDVQKSLTLPQGPSFKKLIDLFSDGDADFNNHNSSLKAKKLILILRTLIQKQKRQGLRSLERSSLEKVTLTTLQLLCGVIFKRIAKVPRGDLQPDDFQQQYRDIIQPVQKVFLDEGIVEMLIGLLHHPKDDIAFQVLACLNVLLYPGNEEAQKRITAHVNEQDRSLFLRVHQILRRAQSSLSTAKMSNALAQIAALIQDQGETSSSAVKLLERNKSAVFSSFISQSTDDLSPSGSQVQLTRRSAAIEGTDRGASVTKFSIVGSKLESNFTGIQFVDYRITMALNVLSWLCDGQQKDMQDILRDDKTFSGSNIVSQVAFLLHGIAENLNEGNIGVAQGAVQALIEMCAGNYSNQIIAFKGQVVFSIDTIIQEDFTSSSAIRPLRKLKSSSIELMEVMLEETDENSPLLAQWITSQWNMSNFLGAMFSLWHAYSEPFNISDREQLRNSIFRAYHVLRRIADHKDTSVNKLVGYKKHSKGSGTQFDMIFERNVNEAKRMWQYCQLWSRSVEIVYTAKSGKEILTRTYFPYDPHKHLNENEKDTILLHVKRNTPQEKLSDLLQWTEAIRSAHAWKKKVKSSWKTYWILWASTIRHFMLFWLTIFLNSLVFFALEVPPDYRNSNSCSSDNETCNSTSVLYFRPILIPKSPNWYDPVLYIAGAVHLILAIWMVLQYYAKHWSNLRFEILFIKKTLYNAKKGLLRRKYIYQCLHFLNKVFCCGRFQSTRPQPEKYFQIFFFGFEPIYRILFLFFSILGLASGGYFYCGCMIYLFLRNHVLLYVLRAVRKSALQLITIFILVLVVIYIYAVISFVLLPNYFVHERDEFCNTIFQCFVTITRLGLLDTLGTGIGIRPSNEYQPNFNIVGWRTLYDLIFFIVVTTLALNIVIAVLVDRFSDLREEKDKIDDDNDTRCFICSIKKDVFERHGLNFQKHWQVEHNVWNYIHFVLYLDTLHPNDHNALEKYVSHQVPSVSNPAGFIDFFPMFKAKILPHYDVTKEVSN